MKRIPLTPYPGVVHFTDNYQELRRVHKRMTGEYPPHSDRMTGLTVPLEKPGYAPTYLVFGKSAATISHEMNHVALMTFSDVGTDPRAGRGEPFCYLQAHLLDEALESLRKKKPAK